MIGHSRRYNQWSILVFILFFMLVSLQLLWLYKAAQFKIKSISQNLEIIAPDIALKINELDHDAFHVDIDSISRVSDSLINKIVEEKIFNLGIKDSVAFAIYSDSTDLILKSNSDMFYSELINSKAKACLSCITSFSTINIKDRENFDFNNFDREKFETLETFQYYSPIKAKEGESILWFSLYYPNLKFKVIKELSVLFLFNFLLLIGILFLLNYLIRSINNYKTNTQAKEDFFNNMTHEFKTPLSSIRLASRMLTQQSASEKNTEFLSLIEKESIKLEMQVDKLLELSLIENSKQELNFQELDIKKLIQDLPRKFAPLLANKKATINIDAPLRPVLMYGDTYHMSSVFSNLVDNSIKYGQVGVFINISLKVDNNIIELRFSDNGPGIAPEHQPHVFERFYRGQSDDSYKGPGFGIGLSYVKSILKEHGGTIELEDSNDGGTSFNINIKK